MATTTPSSSTLAHVPVPLPSASDPQIPALHAGDRLTQQEFLRRYHAMKDVSHAELIEGVVYMPSPVRAEQHGEPHFDLNGFLFTYRVATPGVVGGDNSTCKFDPDNVPQPDGYLRIESHAGGQSRLINGYIEGAPEFIVEIAASTASYDLHDKLQAYRRNGVREYVVWRVEEEAIDWLKLVEGKYEPLTLDEQGVGRSEVFPGLWIDTTSLLAGDAAAAMKTMQEGIASESHQKFLETLAVKSKKSEA